MRAYERFLHYVQVYTTSDPDARGRHPSARRQFDLAHMLVAELQALGVANAKVDSHCIVTAHLEATPGCEKAPAIGFLAHLDTAPDAPGEHVEPLLHPGYDGGDIVLPSGRVLSPKELPALAALKGKTVITASGNTLLGADNKAGIAEIVTLVQELQNRNVAHGKVCIAFTPDEEIGEGTACFDVAAFGADFAYTVDGGPAGEIEYETFNAARAEIEITGVEVHPGAAKGIMVNALRLARDIDAALPAAERPETTQGREGYYHLHTLQGTAGHARMQYLLRDHSEEQFARRKNMVHEVVENVRKHYPKAKVALTVTDEYKNMAPVVLRHPHLLEFARQAIRQAGASPVTSPVRGGTDGSMLSYKGLPCPNLGTGGLYFHGPNECIAAEDMDTCTEILLEIVRLYAQADKTTLA